MWSFISVIFLYFFGVYALIFRPIEFEPIYDNAENSLDGNEVNEYTSEVKGEVWDEFDLEGWEEFFDLMFQMKTG